MFANNFWFWMIVVLGIIGYMLYVLQQERIFHAQQLVKQWSLEEQKKPLYPPMNDDDWKMLLTKIDEARNEFN